MQLIENNGKFGFADESGRVVIEPKFDYATKFMRGRAYACLGERIFTVDASGVQREVLSFKAADDFHEGLAAVKSGGKCGFIDKSGKFRVRPKFDFAASFCEGLARVACKGRRFFIDKAGELVIPPKFNKVGDFHDGLAKFMDRDSKKWGFIGKNGDILIEPKFSEVGDFSEGFATAKLQKWGYINTKGEEAIPFMYDGAGLRSQGLMAVKVGEKWGFIDENNSIVVPPSYLAVDIFIRGIAQVIRRERAEIYPQYAFIDTNGKLIVPFGKYQTLSGFYDEFTAVQDQEYISSFIDSSGNVALPQVFDAAHHFCEGLAFVSQGEEWDDKWGVIDKSANLVIPPFFYRPYSDFSEGLALVRLEREYILFFIDKSGEPMLKPQ